MSDRHIQEDTIHVPDSQEPVIVSRGLGRAIVYKGQETWFAMYVCGSEILIPLFTLTPEEEKRIHTVLVEQMNLQFKSSKHPWRIVAYRSSGKVGLAAFDVSQDPTILASTGLMPGDIGRLTKQ